MANATATLTVNAYPNGVDNTQRRQALSGLCVLLLAGLYVANGIPINWAALLDGNGGSGAFILDGPATVVTGSVFFFSQTARNGANTNYTYVYDYVHGTLAIFLGGTELAGGAAISTDTIGFNVEFNRS
jgi:hypothetical protein